MAVSIAFAILILMTVFSHSGFQSLRQKKWDDWILDLTGLIVQGILIPFLQLTLVYKLYAYCLPLLKGSLAIDPAIAFLLSFVVVDYLYYWNHRLLHTRSIWHLHMVHHTVTTMDVLGTSRNTVWTSFLIVYLWVHALLIFLLQDPFWYVVGVSLTSILDLWRHSEFNPNPKGWLYPLLDRWLMLPQDHAWHHADQDISANFGANFKLWDRLHGTYSKIDRHPTSLGIETDLTLMQKLLYPTRT